MSCVGATGGFGNVHTHRKPGKFFLLAGLLSLIRRQKLPVLLGCCGAEPVPHHRYGSRAKRRRRAVGCALRRPLSDLRSFLMEPRSRGNKPEGACNAWQCGRVCVQSPFTRVSHLAHGRRVVSSAAMCAGRFPVSKEASRDGALGRAHGRVVCVCACMCVFKRARAHACALCACGSV